MGRVPEVGLEAPEKPAKVGNRERAFCGPRRRESRKASSQGATQVDPVLGCVHLGCTLRLDHPGLCVTPDGQSWLLRLEHAKAEELGAEQMGVTP